MVDFSDPYDNLAWGVWYLQYRYPEWFDKDYTVWVDSSDQARRAKENNMSKKIEIGDTLTVGDLTDDYIGAVVEVGPVGGFTTRFKVQDVTESSGLMGLYVALRSEAMETRTFKKSTPVTVITPPPMEQPDEPTIIGQCVRFEGDNDWWAVVTRPGTDNPFISMVGGRWSWPDIMVAAGTRKIIVSDPPRWPEEDSEIPERIEVGEWPENDENLREWKWLDADGDLWHWYDEPNDYDKVGWGWFDQGGRHHKPFCGPWTRGGRTKVKKAVPKAGDVFTRIKDMPYGWVAKAVDNDGEDWGYVVREDSTSQDGFLYNHLWSGELVSSYRTDPVSEWVGFGKDSVSGGYCQSYTLVETVEDHDSRVAPSSDF